MNTKKSLVLLLWFASLALLLTACASSPSETSTPTPVPLRLSVALTPQELESFQAALEALENDHPEWLIELETVPQAGFAEKINAQLAANDLPDIVRVQGLTAPKANCPRYTNPPQAQVKTCHHLDIQKPASLLDNKPISVTRQPNLYSYGRTLLFICQEIREIYLILDPVL